MVEVLTGSRARTGTPGGQRHRGRSLTSLLSAPGVTCRAEPQVSACWPTPARLRPCPSTQWISGFPFLLQSWVAQGPLAPVLQASPGDSSRSCAKVIPVPSSCLDRCPLSHTQRTAHGTSLAVQWLGLHPPIQGMWDQSLVGELISHMPHSPTPKQNET